ncbi:hypothetical protein LguiA_019271 [Lonicera macranthoides]
MESYLRRPTGRERGDGVQLNWAARGGSEGKISLKEATDSVRIERVTSDDNGLVRREAIEKVVKEIMDEEKGNAIRNKIKVLKDASTKVLGEDGSSTKSLSNLVIKLKIKRNID